jgi:hypothetical protein
MHKLSSCHLISGNQNARAWIMLPKCIRIALAAIRKFAPSRSARARQTLTRLLEATRAPSPGFSRVAKQAISSSYLAVVIAASYHRFLNCLAPGFP